MKPPTSLFLVGLSVAVVAYGAVTNPDPMESSIAHRRLANASLTASPAVSQDHVIASWSVCGDGHCDRTYQGFGETCGNCPVDCGPCQRADDADECVEPLQYVLAFNDGPSAVTSSLLDVLDVYNVKANFFAIGERLDGHGSDFKQQRQRGHRQFGHSFNHSSSLTLSLQELYDDLSMTTNAFQRHGCYRPMLYRPPYGLQGAPQRKLATKLGMRAALWNLDTLDWLYAATNPGKLIVGLESRLLNLRPRGVIQLQHDLIQPSVDVTPAIIRTVQSMGYRFVSLEQCLLGENYRLNPTWIFSEAGCRDVDWKSLIEERTANFSSLDTVPACPTSDWSEWSLCDAECGPGTSTRIRYSLPLDWELFHDSCSSVSFIEMKECTLLPVCPEHVWFDGNETTVTSLEGFDWNATDIESLSQTKCVFSDWRWPNTTQWVCSKPCGDGTHVMVRDFIGTGRYLEACGPLLKTVLCKLQSCPLPRSMSDNTITAFGVLIGLGSVFILLCVSVHVWLRFKGKSLRAVILSAVLKQSGHASNSRSNGTDKPSARVSVSVATSLSVARHGSSEDIPGLDGAITSSSRDTQPAKPTYGPTPPVIEPVSVNYFSRGNIVGTFVVRNGLDNFVDPRPHIPESLVAEVQQPPAVVVFQEVLSPGTGMVVPQRRSNRRVMSKSFSNKVESSQLRKSSPQALPVPVETAPPKTVQENPKLEEAPVNPQLEGAAAKHLSTKMPAVALERVASKSHRSINRGRLKLGRKL